MDTKQLINLLKKVDLKGTSTVLIGYTLSDLTEVKKELVADRDGIPRKFVTLT